jgi:hypothetical protein
VSTAPKTSSNAAVKLAPWDDPYSKFPIAHPDECCRLVALRITGIFTSTHFVLHRRGSIGLFDQGLAD